MGTCHTVMKTILFDYTDEQVTQVRVEIDFSGDCPISLKRVYEKTFPARIPTTELLTMEGGVHSYLLW